MEDSGLQQCGGGPPLLSLEDPKYSFPRLYRRNVLLTLSLLNYIPAQLRHMRNPDVFRAQRFLWLGLSLWFRSRENVVWICCL